MVRYAIKHSDYSSHTVIPKLLGRGEGRRLLDVGCADGEMTARFAQAGWVVTGIEPDQEDAQAARQRGVEVLQLPLEEALSRLSSSFDAIVLADVLEHCVNPWQQLAAVMDHCEPNGQVIISLPNIAHVVPRLQVLLGRFDYEERGILDRTHLRFFTRKTALNLVAGAGLLVDSITYTPTPVELVFPHIEEARVGRELLAWNARLAKMAPKLLGYQFVMSCRKPIGRETEV